MGKRTVRDLSCIFTTRDKARKQLKLELPKAVVVAPYKDGPMHITDHTRNITALYLSIIPSYARYKESGDVFAVAELTEVLQGKHMQVALRALRVVVESDSVVLDDDFTSVIAACPEIWEMIDEPEGETP